MFDTYYDIMVIVETLNLKRYTSTLSAGEHEHVKTLAQKQGNKWALVNRNNLGQLKQKSTVQLSTLNMGIDTS